MSSSRRVVVRNTTPADFAGVISLTEATYPGAAPWREKQLESHLAQFTEGQLVAIDTMTNEVVGMAASLIILWDDYNFDSNWRDFTSNGTFANHDPLRGKTLYGAEVMVLPGRRGLGIGKALYAARREIAERYNLKRIRAGARLRGYHRFAQRMSAAEYAHRISRGVMRDPTLSFQLREGFKILGVAENYLRNDPESLGWAAVIEWLNQRGTMPPHNSASGASGSPTLETTTRADSPADPGTTANSAA